MGELPYTVLSAAMTLDGYCDSASEERLVLSNAQDLDRVDEVRAGCDAILVGAATVRIDSPRLVVRSAARTGRRLDAGMPPTPAKVTVTGTGDLDPDEPFFTTGDTAKLVYCASDIVEQARHVLGAVATVVGAGQPVLMRRVCQNLHERGVRRLMVEGGGRVLTQFLTEDLADELHLAVAPFFVGDSRARRLVDDGAFPWNADRRGTLLEARPLGDVVLLRYALSARCPGPPEAPR
ncbi:MAG: RibD family protein [Actinomycetes bacterium]